MPDTNQLSFHESFFSDHTGDRYLFYTGKNDVLGLKYPDSAIINDLNTRYVKVATMKLPVVGSTTSNMVEVNEILRISYIRSGNLYTKPGINAIVSVIATYNPLNKDIAVNAAYTPISSPVELDELLEDAEGTNDSMKVSVTYEEITSDGITIPTLGVWIDLGSNSGVGYIYVESIESHAANTAPLNVDFVTNDYNLEITSNQMLHEESTTYTSDLESYIVSTTKASAKNPYRTLVDALKTLIARPSTEIHYGEVTYDVGFEPVYTGNEATQYQLIPPSTINSVEGVTFAKSDIANNYIQIMESGTYILQLVSGIFVEPQYVTAGTTTTGRIEVVPYLNNDTIESMRLMYDPKQLFNQISTGMYTVNLNVDDIIRLRFRFLGTPGSDIRNSGYTYMKMTKIL